MSHCFSRCFSRCLSGRLSGRFRLAAGFLFLALAAPVATKAMELLPLPFEARIAVPPLLVMAIDSAPQALQSSWPQAYQAQAEYEGYFHHGLCYRHEAGVFIPAREADGDHYCSGSLWSGNFLNWAGMSALDTLRYALTGGARAQDSDQLTVLARADLGKQAAENFNKRLDAQQADIARLLPYDLARIFLRSCGQRLQLWRVAPTHACGTRAPGLLSEVELQVQVCGDQDRRPWLCKAYGRASKPEGLLQAAAPWLRMALQVRGGFLGGGLIGAQSLGRNWSRQDNPHPEWDTGTGIMAPGATLLRQVSRAPPASNPQSNAASLLQAALQPESRLTLASCQRTHVLRWPQAETAAQDGATQLAALRRQFARMQLDTQRSALPAQVSMAMQAYASLYLASTDPATFSSSLQRYALETERAGTPLLPPNALWEASLPEAGQRKLLTSGSQADGGRLLALSASRLSPGQLQALGKSPSSLRPDGLLMERLAWLRGNMSVQESGGGQLADRQGSFASQFGGNLAWLESPAGQAWVFMTTGEGLLHAIDAATGKEAFAWMPSALLARLPAAAAPDFPAQSLLDGGISVGSLAGQGKNLPVLAVAGGHSVRGVFALTLADPSRSAGSGWRALEFTEADDARVGHVLQAPQFVRIATGSAKDKTSRPFLLFSSGVNATAGLFLLALDGTPGAPWVEGSNYFFFPAGSATLAPGAHLASAAAVSDDEQNLRHAWAGDEHGRLWRFSLAQDATVPAGFAVSVALVFNAAGAKGESQIISSAPRIAYGPQQGWLVLFGTGQWLEAKDAAPAAARQESFYGLLDRPGVAGMATRADLNLRKLAPSEAGFRVEGAKSAPGSRGWVIDFPLKGERVVQAALLREGRVMFTSLIAPNSPCDALAWRSWDLDALQGTSPLPTGRSARRSLLTPLVLPGPDAASSNAFGQRRAGAASIFLEVPAPGAALDGIPVHDPLPLGRLAWREIHNWSRLHAAQSKPSQSKP